jgi:hypothetical protein
VANVFISYARRDKERVARLTEALEGEGLSVWWDSDLVPGRRYRTIIAEQLAAADSVIVVWTAAALQSDWVQDEAEEARQRGVLIPVTLELVRPPAGFRQVQAADLSQWTGSPQHPDFRSLVFAVRSLVQVAEAGRRTSAPPTPGQVVPTPEAAQTEPELAEPDPESPRRHPLSAPSEPAQAQDPPELAPSPPLAAPVVVASEPAVAEAPQRSEALNPATTSPALSARFVAAAFSWQWWLAAALAHLIAVATICSADHDFVVWPFLFAGAPIVAALLAAASQRAGLGARTRRWVAWPSFAAGLLTVAWFVTRSHNRQVELAFGSVFFFITATGGVFILCAGVALLAHAARPHRRPMVGTAPAREGGDHRGR